MTRSSGAIGGVSRKAILRQGYLPAVGSRRVIAFGHSMVDYGRNVANGSYMARGLVPWVRALAKGRIDCGLGDIYATAGADLETLANSYLNQIVARTDVDVVMVLAVTNTLSSKFAATDWDNHIVPLLTRVRDALLGAGKTIIWVVDPPRGNSSVTGVALTSTALRNSQRYRRWVLAQGSLPGFIPVDTWPIAGDGGAEGYNRAAYFADGLHPNQLGAYHVFGRLILPVIERLFPSRNILPVSNADQISLEQPDGCCTVNPMTLGTGGTITAPAAGTMTGQLATSYTASLANGAGLAIALSKFVDPDGTEWQRIVASGTPTSNGAELSLAIQNATGLASGDRLDFVAAARVAAAQTGINQLALNVFDGGAGVNHSDMSRLTQTDYYPAEAVDIIMRVPRFTIGTLGTIAPKVALAFRQGENASATVDVRCPAGRKVIA